MEVGKIYVNATKAYLVFAKAITKNLKGCYIRVDYTGEPWDRLDKKVVFSNGLVEKGILTNAEEILIPPEVLDTVGAELKVGVCGYNSDGTLIIPTVFACLGDVQEAPDVDCEESDAKPTPPVWMQILNKIGDLDELTTEAKENLVAAINEVAEKAGNVDEEDVLRIIEEYLAENPAGGGDSVYVLGEGETIEDAPEDADVVIDPNGEGTEIPTEKDYLAMLIETDMLPAVHDASGAILTDENGKVILRY